MNFSVITGNLSQGTARSIYIRYYYILTTKSCCKTTSEKKSYSFYLTFPRFCSFLDVKNKIFHKLVLDMLPVPIMGMNHLKYTLYSERSESSSWFQDNNILDFAEYDKIEVDELLPNVQIQIR